MKKFNLKQHTALIFTSISVVGVIGTAILGVRAGMKAERIMRDLKDVPEDPKEKIKLYVKETWQCYVLVSLTALLSAGAAIASHKISAKDIARLATLATGSGAAFSKYRGKVKEILGEEKEKEIFEQVKVEGPGICYPRIVDQEDEYYDDLYVRYRLDLGVDEIPPIEFDSNPQRVTSAFYAVNRDFALGRIIDVALLKDYLGVKYNDIDHKYFWIDSMFWESGLLPWIDFQEHYEDRKDPECDEDRTVHIITVEDSPIDNKTLEKIEEGSFWS